MTSQGQNPDPRREPPPHPRQESSSESPGDRSTGVAPEPSVMSRARAEPSATLSRAPAFGHSAAGPQVFYFAPLRGSSSEMPADCQTQTATTARAPLAPPPPDLQLSRQLNQQFMEQLLREHPEDREKVHLMLERLFLFMEIVHLKTPREIILNILHAQPPMRTVLVNMLDGCPSGIDANLLLNRILMKLFTLYTSPLHQKPGSTSTSQKQQQHLGQQHIYEEDQGLRLHSNLFTSQSQQQQLQSRQLDQGQVLQPHLPTFQGQQQLRGSGEQQQVLQWPVPGFQQQQQQQRRRQQPQNRHLGVTTQQTHWGFVSTCQMQPLQGHRSGQGRQQGQVQQSDLPPLQYHCQPQVSMEEPQILQSSVPEIQSQLQNFNLHQSLLNVELQYHYLCSMIGQLRQNHLAWLEQIRPPLQPAYRPQLQQLQDTQPVHSRNQQNPPLMLQFPWPAFGFQPQMQMLPAYQPMLWNQQLMSVPQAYSQPLPQHQQPGLSQEEQQQQQQEEEEQLESNGHLPRMPTPRNQQD